MQLLQSPSSATTMDGCWNIERTEWGWKIILPEKCPYSELFCFVISSILTEYGEILRISPYSVLVWENMDQNNSEYGHFLRSVEDSVFSPIRTDNVCVRQILVLNPFPANVPVLYPLKTSENLWLAVVFMGTEMEHRMEMDENLFQRFNTMQINYQWLSLLHSQWLSIHKKWSFPLRISSVNVTKSAVSCGFGHICWRNPSWKISFFCASISINQQLPMIIKKYKWLSLELKILMKYFILAGSHVHALIFSI